MHIGDSLIEKREEVLLKNTGVLGNAVKLRLTGLVVPYWLLQ
jgi:hypothetical protein